MWGRGVVGWVLPTSKTKNDLNDDDLVWSRFSIPLVFLSLLFPHIDNQTL